MRCSAFLMTIALGSLAGCGPGDRPRHSLVLVTLDTTRADALSASGAPAGLTPYMDALAAEGVLYERAYAVAPLTLPSHASMLTGLYPPRHGVRTNGTQTLPASARTLAEWAADTGAQTAAFLGALVLSPTFGLNQGFEIYDSPRHSIRQRTTFYAERPASEVVGLAIPWLEERDRSRPFFLWVHLWDPHGPYDPPADFRERAPGNPYLGEVAAMDDALGQLVAAMKADGCWDDTVVVVVGDHGEAFGEHGEYSHSAYCYDSTMRVPLVIKHPGGKRAGERSREIVSVVDVFATGVDALGLHVREMRTDGLSLLGGPVPAERGAYLESYYGNLSYGWSPLVGWVDAQGKYLHSSQPQLFGWSAVTGQLDEDQDLTQPGADPPPEKSYVRAIADVLARPALPRDESAGIDSATRQGIAALGYSAMGTDDVADPFAETRLPSPASRIEEYQKILLAQDNFNAERYAEAEALHMEVLDDNAGNLYSLERLGISRIRQRRHREAIEPLERVVGSGKASPDAIVQLGVCLRIVGRNERAIQCCERALEIDRNHVWALRLLVDLLEREGRSDEAREYVERYEALTGTSIPDRPEDP